MRVGDGDEGEIRSIGSPSERTPMAESFRRPTNMLAANAADGAAAVKHAWRVACATPGGASIIFTSGAGEGRGRADEAAATEDAAGGEGATSFERRERPR
jgi:hypothetical protein